MSVSLSHRHLTRHTDLRRADWDMVFPDDEREANPASFKFLEMAHKWKRAQATGGANANTLLASKPAAPPPVPSKPAIADDDNDDDSDMASSNEE